MSSSCAILGLAAALLLLHAGVVLGATECSSQRCDKCTADGKACASCGWGFGLDANATCQRCAGSLCVACDGANYRKCLQCTRGAANDDFPIYLDTKGVCRLCKRNPKASGCNACGRLGNCKSCYYGWWLSNRACSPCPKNCGACNGKGVCTECEYGFYIKPDKACVKCPGANCGACKKGGVCKECKAGYRLNASNKCSPCTDPLCASCATAKTVCDYCKTEDMKDIYKNSTGQCTVCQDGPAGPSCDYCDPGTGLCSRCFDNFGLVGSTCLTCADAGCLACDGDVRKCTECLPGYKLKAPGVCMLITPP